MAPPNQLHAALVSEKMVQGCPDQHSSGLPTKKKKQTLLERITFPDSTGMPQSERVLFKGSKYTVKVVGADRKGKWLRDVLRGYRYIQFFPVCDPQTTSHNSTLGSLKTAQECFEAQSSGLPTKNKKQTLLEKITFPDSTGMPQSERVLFKGSKYTVKVVGADRKGKWLRDVLRGYRYIQIFPVNSLSEATVCETHSRPKPVQSPVATHSPPPHSKATQRKRSVV